MLIDPYQFQPVRIERIVREATRAVSVQLTMPANYIFTYGQHAVVRVTMPDGSRLVRQYSYSSAPSSNELWLTVVQESNGQVSTWFIEHATVGDAIEISHPFAGPLMQEIPRGEICMIAGGSGIAPLVSLVGELRNQKKPFTLLYSTRQDEECFAESLVPLPGETISIRLTDMSPRLTKGDILSTVTPESVVFICGSRPFVIAMREYCEEIVPSTHIFSEAFSL